MAPRYNAFREDNEPMPRLRRWTRIAAALALLGAAGRPRRGGGGGDMPPGPPQVQLSVERVFPALTFSAPVAMLQAPNDTSRWFVVEQGGVARVSQSAPAVAATTTPDFIDISGQVTFSGGVVAATAGAFWNTRTT